MCLYVCICVCVFLCFQAIESFAVTVKEIAQLLQGFGSELAETELPDEAGTIDFLLTSHTHRYRQLKVKVAPSQTHIPSVSSVSVPALLCVSGLQSRSPLHLSC